MFKKKKAMDKAKLFADLMDSDAFYLKKVNKLHFDISVSAGNVKGKNMKTLKPNEHLFQPIDKEKAIEFLMDGFEYETFEYPGRKCFAVIKLIDSI